MKVMFFKSLMYLLGGMFVICSISIFTFSIYLIPLFMFNAKYTVPDFIIMIMYWYKVVKELSDTSLIITVILPYILASGILGLVAVNLIYRAKELQNTEGVIKLIMKKSIISGATLMCLFLINYMIVIKFS